MCRVTRPVLAINGTIGYSAQNFSNLFQDQALAGTVGPSYTWNILNYGRLLSTKRLRIARFQELVTTYRNTVLSADRDVENGLVTFLRAQQREKSQAARKQETSQRETAEVNSRDSPTPIMT